MKDPSSLNYRELFESVPALFLALDPDLKIVAVSDAYTQATMTRREGILGRGVFDVFPDNPDDPEANGVPNSRPSFERVLTSRSVDAMAVQKHEVRSPGSEGAFIERWWSPLNSPVIGADGQVKFIIHRVGCHGIREIEEHWSRERNGRSGIQDAALADLESKHGID